MLSLGNKPFTLGNSCNTNLLSHDEYGVYIRLLEYMWQSGGKLPNDDTKIAYYLRISEKKWQNYKKILQPLFSFSEQTFTHIELKKEYNKAKIKSQQYACNAVRRWEKNRNNREIEAAQNDNELKSQNSSSADITIDAIALNLHMQSQCSRASDAHASIIENNKERIDNRWQATNSVDKLAILAELTKMLIELFKIYQMPLPMDQFLIGKWLQAGINQEAIYQLVEKILRRISKQALKRPESFAYFSKEIWQLRQR